MSPNDSPVKEKETVKAAVTRILGGENADKISIDHFMHEMNKRRQDGGAMPPPAATADSVGAAFVVRYARREIVFDTSMKGFSIEAMFESILKLKELADMEFGKLEALIFECGFGAFLKLKKDRDVIKMIVTSDMPLHYVKVRKV